MTYVGDHVAASLFGLCARVLSRETRNSFILGNFLTSSSFVNSRLLNFAPIESGLSMLARKRQHHDYAHLGRDTEGESSAGR